LRTKDSWEKALLCAQAALDKKAYDLVILEVGEFTRIAEYFVVCTGRSDIQVQAIGRAIEEALAQAKMKPLAVEGFTHGQWVLIDCADVIIHVLYESAREFYNIEGLWGQAPRRQLPEPYNAQAQHLRLATA